MEFSKGFVFNLWTSLGILILYLTLGNAQSCFDQRGRTGSCLSLVSCPQLVDEFFGSATNSMGMDFQTFIGNSICGFDGYNFMICCPGNRTLIVVNKNPTSSATTSQSGGFLFSSLGGGTLSGTNSNPNSIVFQSTSSSMTAPPPLNTQFQPSVFPPTIVTRGCGTSSSTSNRVVGGMEARRGAYPWIAALGYTEISGLKFLCSGSLISDRYLVTSAHCINALLSVVRLGAHDLSKSSETGAVDYTIKRTIVHEQFNLSAIANDIAMIQLNGVASNTPICLPEGVNFQTQDFVGMNPFIAGWGAVNHQGPTSNVLRDAQVPVVMRQICEQSYKTVFKFVEFSEKLICAGNSNVDACQGDSGGPLMMPQLDGSMYRFHLLGIVSFGYECARTGFPGVYTRVASYVPWIKKNMLLG